ncbi:MAG: N4-gp56 family major capsid protein [Clostridia bacterium]|nr:N4-gp56 family major capsid protein [Clostridia bacterium]
MKKFSLKLFGAGDVVNTTLSNGEGNDLSAEMKTFYDKALIELATPNLVHDQFGQKRKIPKNGGKSVEFRCFSTLPKATGPITEGVTPTGNKLNVKSIVCTPDQYGDYIEMSDVFELTSVDNTIVEATKKLADQAGRTLDTIVRNELNGGTNVMYCPIIGADGSETEITSRLELALGARLTVKQVYKAAAELKAMNAPKIDGYYVGIIHPYAAYDLMQDAGDRWLSVGQYNTPGGTFVGEIGCIGGVRFVESSEAKIDASYQLGPNKVYNVRFTEGDNGLIVDGEIGTFVLDNPIPAIIDGEEANIIRVKYEPMDEMTTIYFDRKVEMCDTVRIVATEDNSSVFSTLILGADAYGVTEMEDGIENIIKQKGYGNDPLNQRSSVGWKAFKCAKRLVEEYMIRIESVSDFAPNAPAN